MSLKSIIAKKRGLTWGQFIKNGIIFRRNQLLDPLIMPLYRHSIIEKRMWLRRKSVIKVAFVVPELGFWKTEALYRAMLQHERFRPVLLVIPSTEVPTGADAVVEYFKSRGYDYIDMRQTKKSIKQVLRPDIIFYQKPYDYSLPHKYNFRKNGYALFGYVSYCFHNVTVRDINETPLIHASWQVYYENQPVMEETERLMKDPCGNGVVTGLPDTDDLIASTSEQPDPWKTVEGGKRLKRVIWAPHHSVGSGDHAGMDYSTFLEYADFMLEMARKYADRIQFAFKPHPLLRNNLRACWPKEKIDAYYRQWETLPNTQLELGSYKGLFVHSDAMIHDCGSFTIEYLYTQHPVMYLLKHDHHESVLNEFATQSFRLHYMGYSAGDIDQFLQNVCEDIDEKQAERKAFFDSCLLPPNNCSACENIINAILK